MRTVFMVFTHKFENEEYQWDEGVTKFNEYCDDGFPVRDWRYDNETDTVFVHFGCKGATLDREEE